MKMKAKPHIAVIGAGAFGGWTALHLLERGARVTLLDAWGPGNSRSSSGGETRIMRAAYGPDQPYTEMAARSLKLWAKYEKRWKRQFLHRIGVLWMASGQDDAFERGSITALRHAKIKYQELSVTQMKKRWPQINFEGILDGLFEPESGYLDARASCQAVVEAFAADGGEYRQLAIVGEPGGVAPASRQLSREHPRFRKSQSLETLSLSDGSRLKADIYVFACGPWLGKMFPTTIGDLIQPTKQDVFFFGTPAGTDCPSNDRLKNDRRTDDRFTGAHLPVWGDHHDRFYYGIPGDGSRGFKVADDTRGPAFDPTHGERIVSQPTLQSVREYLALRFPALKDASLVESRVCQYEQTPDGHFIIDRHPEMENVWLIGGGSGHGFKHGPAIGEMLADLILKEREPKTIWRLERFQKQ
jgi:sarcosine oxidase